MKQLKQFVPLTIDATLFDWLKIAAKARPVDLQKKIGHMYSTDPVGSSWSTIGLVQPIEEDRYVHNLDGTAFIIMFQYNKRNLPGAVRNETLAKRVKEFQERAGLPITKVDFARLRDEVQDELLPQAFINRTLVPVLVYPDKLLICTTSQKLLDDVLRELFKLAGVNASINFAPEYFRYVESPSSVFKLLATGDNETGEQDHFTPGNALQLKGADKRTITVKDREAGGYEVQQLIEADEYIIVELRMGWRAHPGDDIEAEFTMNDRGHFKAIKLASVAMKDVGKEDTHTTAWIMAKSHRHMLGDVVGAMGGLAKPKESDDDLDL